MLENTTLFEGINCSLSAFLDDSEDVWYVVEDNGFTVTETRSYAEALGIYVKLDQKKRKEQGE